MPTSRFVPGRYPQQGSSAIADKIRERRGARGLTPLDGTLLHVPPVAEGWNSLLGAVRTKGKLPGDVRELMILRVAARNHAMFEWIHHEHVGRDCGLTTQQLTVIRNTAAIADNKGVLSALQMKALVFADASTKDVKVNNKDTLALKEELALLAKGDEQEAQDLLVEAAAVVASYNMVSRFLVSLDVAGMSDELVPWPSDHVEYRIPLPEAPESHLFVETFVSDLSNPWLVFSNSLLTNTSMWSHTLPHLISSSYNIVLHDQRGHGKSSTPLGECTIQLLAKDISLILDTLHIDVAHAVIGVSQGGAAILSFAAQFPERTKCVVACDTGPRTPPGNKEAWTERIQLAKDKSMSALASVTAARWFPPGSTCHPKDPVLAGRAQMMLEMIEQTTVEGFALGAGALMEYDLIEDQHPLLDSKVKTLLVAGSLDGDGKVAKGMEVLKDKWNEKRQEEPVQFVVIEGSGHLPMVDEPDKFWSVIGPFVGSLKTT
ncbi:beta-ketoadipate enol-lactone hydrolase [Mycena floridula]|nr:beta-ketoadipate enol-lactone hydrolase [Mycena floridula]